jgi:CBS domain-containing protein
VAPLDKASGVIAVSLVMVTCRAESVASGTSVADAMLARPKVSPADTTVARALALLADDHVHAVLVVDAGRLLAVVERPDLVDAPPAAPAREYGRLAGRVVGPHEDLPATWRAMAAEPRRRLAVVDPAGALLGLLCLKRTGRGFCAQADVDARARERADALAT